MIPFLGNVYLDRFSFWAGFLAGSLFLWILSRLRPWLPVFWRSLKGRAEAARQGITASTEERYRKDILRTVQKLHLAAPLFSLDEIAVTPYLNVAPPKVDPGSEANYHDVFSETLPYMPDWPELAAALHGPRLTLPQAMEGGANLVLIGQPGSGKTFALAYLASQAARKDPQAGAAASLLPVYVHAADFVFPTAAGRSPIEIFSEAAGSHASALTLPRLPSLLRAAFESGQALILLDGLDELPPEPAGLVSELLGLLLQQCPKVRVIAAASDSFQAGLPALGLAPLSMSVWNQSEQADFVSKWRELWVRHIEQNKEDPDRIDPILLEGWLRNANTSATPLETTLKTWAAFAGDLLGPQTSLSIEAFVLRMTANIPKARPVLEKVAAQSICTLTAVIGVKEAEKWAQETETQSTTPFEGTDTAFSAEEDEQADREPVDGQAEQQASKPAQKPSLRVLDQLLASSLFVQRKDGRVTFAHPLLASYLAGAALASSGGLESVAEQPEWTGRNLTLQFASAWNDLTPLVAPWIEQKDDPLFRKTLTAARWLGEAPKNARWRPAAMRRLAGLLQQEMYSLRLRGRIVAALGTSGDPNVAMLFRQLLQARQGSVRQLGALGCGLLRDPKAITDLIGLLDDPEFEVCQAAMLALSAYGTSETVEAVASVLLGSSEEMRRAAAEILANDPVNGHDLLREGTQLDDLLVRRAVVYGLARVGEPWAMELLEKMQVEDGQWVVRSAATEAVEAARQANPYIPRPLPALHELPWLLVFAAKSGVGVMQGKQAMEMLLLALRSGTDAERLAALDVLNQYGDQGAIPGVFNLLYGSQGHVREAAFDTVWRISAAGIEMPDPTQFGLG